MSKFDATTRRALGQSLLLLNTVALPEIAKMRIKVLERTQGTVRDRVQKIFLISGLKDTSFDV